MLGSSSLTQVFRMCNTGLHPLYVNVESITPDYHMVLRNNELSQWCALGENTILSWNFSEGSPYNATVVLSKIRCIKGLTSHANHKWQDMAIIILCLWSPSPKYRHDFHHHQLDTLISIAASWSSHQLFLLQLSLTHSDKVKQLITWRLHFIQ